MNLLLLFPTDLPEGRRAPASEPLVGDMFVVRGERARACLEQLEPEPGRLVHVGWVDGPVGRAEVVACDAEAIELRLAERRAPPRPSRGRLLLAMPKAKVLKRLLPQLAALGLEEIVIFRSWRVDRSDLGHALLQPGEADALLHEGMAQACLTRKPRLRVERRFRPWVEDRLPSERPEELRIIAHPRADPSPPALPPLGPRPWSLVVGPERGLLDEEVASFVQAGFQPRPIGRGILRVETACVAGLGYLLALET